MTLGAHSQGCDIPDCPDPTDWDGHRMQVQSADGGFVVSLYKVDSDIFYALSSDFPAARLPVPGGQSQSDGQCKVLVLNGPTDVQLLNLYTDSKLGDPASWMGDNVAALGQKALNTIMIPGTHDSGTYGLSSTWAPDLPHWVPAAYAARWLVAPAAASSLLFAPLALLLAAAGLGIIPFVRTWSQAQDGDFTAQLQGGIRYLDLRVAPTNGSNDSFSLVHGLYGPDVSICLNLINDFHKSHPTEILILDFNHFYAMDPGKHANLVDLIKTTFGSALVNNAGGSLQPTSTLNQFWSANESILVLYGHDAKNSSGADTVFANNRFLFSQQAIQSPWPEAESIGGLLSYLQDHARPPSTVDLFVTQGVRTPTVGGLMTQGFLPGHPMGLLELAEETNPAVEVFLAGNASNVNIVICDGYAGSAVPQIAIAHNLGELVVSAATS